MSSKSPRPPFEAIDWALAQDVTKVQALLLVSLARHADFDGFCFPSQSRLAEHAHCTRPFANAQLQQLEDAGLIRSRRKQRPNGSEGAKQYLVLFRDGIDWPEEVVSTEKTPPVYSVDTPLSSHQTPPVHSVDRGVSTHRTGIRRGHREETTRRAQAKSPAEKSGARENDRDAVTGNPLKHSPVKARMEQLKAEKAQDAA